MAIIVLVVGWIGLHAIDKFKSFSFDLANEEIPKLRTNASIFRDVSDIVGSANFLAYSTDRDERLEKYKAVEEAFKDLKNKIEKMDSFKKPPEVESVWKDLKEKVKNWQREIEKYFSLMEKFEEMKILNPGSLLFKIYEIEFSHVIYVNELHEYITGEREKFTKTLDPTKCVLGKWLESYKPENEEFKKLLEEIRSVHDGIHNGAKKVVELVEKGETEKAIKVYEEKISSGLSSTLFYMEKMRAIAEKADSIRKKALSILASLNNEIDIIKSLSRKFGKMIDEITNKEVSALSAHANVLTTLAISGMVTGFVVALLVGIFLSNSVTKRIKKLLHAINVFAKRDLTVTFDVSGKDEIALMGSALSDMALSLREEMEKIKSSSVNIEEFSRSLDEFTTRQAQSFEDLSRSVDSVASSAENTSAAIEEVTSGVEEVASSAQNLSNMSQDLTNMANDMASSADEGRNSLQRVMNLIESVAQSSSSTAEIVSEVSKKSQNIGEIVETINSIAEQTNLLALNAAIEAARAGEAGKGFAVVADEIRKLAEESRKATERINLILTEIQEGAQRANDAMNEMVGSVEETKEKAEGAMEKFDNIIERIKEVLTMTENLAATAQEQSAAAQEMASAMDNASKSVVEITDMISKVSDNMKELLDQSQELSEKGTKLRELADELANLVKRFKI